MIRLEEAFAKLHLDSTSQNIPPFSAVWSVPADLPYFNGHFPNFPVFPGVGIIDASVCFLSSRLKQANLQFRSINSAKFLSPIQPNQTVRLDANQLSPSEWQVDWKDHTSGKSLAVLRLQF